MTSLVRVLQVAGSLLELVAIVLVITEIRSRAAQLRNFNTAISTRQVTASVHLTGESALVTTGTTSGPPTLDHRVSALETAVQDELPRAIRAAKHEAIDASAGRMQAAVRDTEQNVEVELDKLRATMQEALGGNRRATWGSVLLVLGVILQGLAGYVGAG